MATKTTQQSLDRLRKIVAQWPETSERISHGAPTFWGGKKTFVSFTVNHHGDGRVAIWCKSSFETQQALVEAEPELFFVPPYVGPSGWIGIRVDRPVSWRVVEELLLEGYRMVAPERALKLLHSRVVTAAAPLNAPKAKRTPPRAAGATQPRPTPARRRGPR